MGTHKPHAERPPRKASATRGFATADHIRGTYPGGPSAGRPGGAQHQRAAVRGTALRGIREVEAGRERLVLRRRHRRRVRHAVEVLVLGLALALSTGIYLGFEAHVSPERATEKVLESSGDIDLSDEMRWLLSELWKMEDMERLPRR